MKVIKTNLEDCFIIEPKVFRDDRGFFLETFKAEDYKQEIGIKEDFVQDNHSRSSKGVLRGLHFQVKNPQGKLVRVSRGSVLDVAVDIRLGSPTFGKYHLVELSSNNKKIFYIPEGFAHGYLVLSEFSIVLYKCTNIYEPKDEHGIKWNDPDLGIKWGNKLPLLSEKDNKLPNLKDQKRLPRY